MDNDTKVRLSVGELATATDKNIILTKRAIIEKAAALFNEQIPIISNYFREVVNHDRALISAVPKISKGENYNGLPYVIMDFPSTFSTENIFALRTMFWWGNFISISLHIKGSYKNRYSDKILKTIFNEPDLYISVGEDEWQHHFEKNNFMKSSLITHDLKKQMERSNFLKIAIKYELHHWNMMQSILPDGYKKLAEIMIG
jgi:hypothetical protein